MSALGSISHVIAPSTPEKYRGILRAQIDMARVALLAASLLPIAFAATP